jgi:2-keto-4-pentenoate hydratase/2-oxohepta-3-ene-1,7-dioic acid hydratase in catechol pathway
MVKPSCSEQLDYEAEMMVVISKGGRHIKEAEALDHVFGYTTFNDGSVRDYQKKTHQWTPGKNFDATGPIGPVVVTPDELPEGGEELKIECRVGDEILQSSTTSDMIWSVKQTIAAVSEYSTLEPGDLIAMGTPPGVGMARKPPRYLRPGEIVEVEIENIGGRLRRLTDLSFSLNMSDSRENHEFCRLSTLPACSSRIPYRRKNIGGTCSRAPCNTTCAGTVSTVENAR